MEFFSNQMLSIQDLDENLMGEMRKSQSGSQGDLLVKMTLLNSEALNEKKKNMTVMILIQFLRMM